MADIIITIICAGLASSVISLFLDDDSDLSKHVRLVVSLCFLCALIPGSVKLLTKFKIDNDVFGEYNEEQLHTIETDYYENLKIEAENEISQKLLQLVFENIGIKLIQCDIELSVNYVDDAVEFDFEKITITTNTNNEVSVLKGYIFDITQIEPEIIVNTGG